MILVILIHMTLHKDAAAGLVCMLLGFWRLSYLLWRGLRTLTPSGCLRKWLSLFWKLFWEFQWVLSWSSSDGSSHRWQTGRERERGSKISCSEVKTKSQHEKTDSGSRRGSLQTTAAHLHSARFRVMMAEQPVMDSAQGESQAAEETGFVRRLWESPSIRL